ncbi:hypothetical protein vseg_009521 [Gypsophila vaccaria]
MKYATRRSKEDKFREFEFTDEDTPEPPNRWLSNPNFVDDGGGDSSGPVVQNKEVPTVTLDDDDDNDDDGDHDGDRCSLDYSLSGLQDSPRKAGCKEPEGLHSIPESDSEQCCLNDSSVNHKLIPPCVEMRLSSQPESLPENGHVSSINAESPCCDGVTDLDDNDIVQESFPSTSDSEMEENDDTTFRQAQYQSVDGSEMDVTDTVVIHTDYVAYGNKYFPASLILISRDSVKMRVSALEEESEASSSEWNVDDILRIETQWSSSADVAKVRIRLLMKDLAPSEITNGTSGIEVVEFMAPNWSQHQERIMSLDMRYNAALSMGVNLKSWDGDAGTLEDSESSSDPFIPNFEEPFEEVVYPKGDRDAVSVGKTDVDLLQPDIFVNDTIIDFYITYLKNEIPRERRHSFHFFSSFFFRKLADLDKNPSSVFDGKAAFQRVRRWTRKVNIFEKDYIFIPVNYNLHWSLIVLCHPGEIANFNEENVDEALKVPCILHMDSIRGSHAGLKDLLQSYLLEEWKERQTATSEDVSSKFLNLRFLSLELPQQENCSDCGLFLLHYAELFINEAPMNFSPFRINKFDFFLKRDWFVPAEASLKRVHIQRLIYELLKSRSHNCVSPSRNILLHSSVLPVNDNNGVEIISEKRSPEKSWNGSAPYRASVQDMDIGLLGMSSYKPSACVDDSSLGMTELFGRCQDYIRGASHGKQGVSMSSVGEVRADGHLANSNFSQAEETHVGSLPGGFDQTFQWNLELSDQDDDSGNTSSSESRSSEEMRTDEYYRGTQSADSCQKDIVDQSKAIGDSYEGYASASSDMMETAPEDSQELADKYGNHDQDGPLFSNQDEVVEDSQKEPDMVEDGNGAVSGADEKLNAVDGEVEDGVVGDVDEMVIVDDSPPHQLRPAKRTRFNPRGELRQHV